jgi:conjugal transfer pilus assembly protein TraD
MVHAFVGRVYSSGNNVAPSLFLHIDEAESVLYQGFEDLFTKAGDAQTANHALAG